MARSIGEPVWLLKQPVRSEGMFVSQGSKLDPESTRMALTLIVTAIVIFWRTVIKLAIIAVILLAAVGALTLSQSVH